MYPFGSYHAIERGDTMTYRNNFTLPVELLEQIAVEVFYVLPDLIKIIGNAAVSIRSWKPKYSLFMHLFFRCRIRSLDAEASVLWMPDSSCGGSHAAGTKSLADSLINNVR